MKLLKKEAHFLVSVTIMLFGILLPVNGMVRRGPEPMTRVPNPLYRPTSMPPTPTPPTSQPPPRSPHLSTPTVPTPSTDPRRSLRQDADKMPSTYDLMRGFNIKPKQEGVVAQITSFFRPPFGAKYEAQQAWAKAAKAEDQKAPSMVRMLYQKAALEKEAKAVAKTDPEKAVKLRAQATNLFFRPEMSTLPKEPVLPKTQMEHVQMAYIKKIAQAKEEVESAKTIQEQQAAQKKLTDLRIKLSSETLKDPNVRKEINRLQTKLYADLGKGEQIGKKLTEAEQLYKKSPTEKNRQKLEALQKQQQANNKDIEASQMVRTRLVGYHLADPETGQAALVAPQKPPRPAQGPGVTQTAPEKPAKPPVTTPQAPPITAESQSIQPQKFTITPGPQPQTATIQTLQQPQQAILVKQPTPGQLPGQARLDISASSSPTQTPVRAGASTVNPEVSNVLVPAERVTPGIDAATARVRQATERLESAAELGAAQQRAQDALSRLTRAAQEAQQTPGQPR
ncbi:hypothetical protein K2W90_00970 [Candidatus Babeliales bacterium]|nr:hypothetical protein [Candidatus Babeliales bacterium]